MTVTKEGYEPQSTTVSMTEADVANGGVSVNMTINKIDNTLLYAGIGVVVAVVVVLMILLVVRRRKKEANGMEKNETSAEANERNRRK